MINRWCRRLSDTASISLKKAHFYMGGINMRKSPHAEFGRFEWTMRRALVKVDTLAVALLAPCLSGQLFARRLSDLGAPNTLQLVPDRNLKRDQKTLMPLRFIVCSSSPTKANNVAYQEPASNPPPA